MLTDKQIEDSYIESNRIMQVGDWLEELISHKYWHVFEEHILNEIWNDSFKAFQRIDPSEINAIIQTQKMGQVVDEIKRRLENKIQIARGIR